MSPRGLPLDFSKGKGRYNYCGGSLNDEDDGARASSPDGRNVGGGGGGGGERGGAKGVKTFGSTTVHVVVQ